jgi:sulfate permease, SulP family
VPALLISVVGFVESVSVGQTLAAKRRQRIEPDRELVAWAPATWARPSPAASPSPGASRARW